MTKIDVSEPELKYYLNSLFNTTFFHKYIAGYASGTSIVGLDFTGIVEYRTEIPDHDVLVRYASLVHILEMKKSFIIKENMELAALRDFLLPLLMNRQVTFKDEKECPA